MLRRKIWRRKKRILVHFKSAVKYNLVCKSATMYRCVCVRDTTYKVYVSRAFRVPEERKYAVGQNFLMRCWNSAGNPRKPRIDIINFLKLQQKFIVITEHPPLSAPGRRSSFCKYSPLSSFFSCHFAFTFAISSADTAADGLESS